MAFFAVAFFAVAFFAVARFAVPFFAVGFSAVAFLAVAVAFFAVTCFASLGLDPCLVSAVAFLAVSDRDACFVGLADFPGADLDRSVDMGSS